MSYGYDFPIVEKVEQDGLTLTVRYDEVDADFHNPRQWTQLGTMLCAHRSYILGDEQINGDDHEFEIDCQLCKGSGDHPERFELYHSYTKVGAGTEGAMNSEYDRLVRIWEEDHPKGEGHGLVPYTVYSATCPNCDGHGQISVSPIEWAKKERGARVVLSLGLYDHSGISMYVGGGPYTPFDSAGWDSGTVGIIFDTPEGIEECMGDHPITDEEIEKSLVSEVEEYDSYLRGEVFCYDIEDDDGEHIDSCGGFLGDYKYALEEGKAALAVAVEQKQKDHEQEFLAACRDIETV